MKAQELRIGNWIKSPIESGGVEGQVKRIDTDKDGYSHYLDHCSPIPLTEEWLVKFGFKYSKEEIEYFIKHYYILNDIEIKIEQWKKNMEFDSSYSLYMDYGYIKSIKYVHQLQNLYFALTGEELTVK